MCAVEVANNIEGAAAHISLSTPQAVPDLSAPHGSTHPVVWNCVNT